MKAEKPACSARRPLSMPLFIPHPSSLILSLMPGALFYIFSAVTLLFGVMVVVCRNPVASALSLVVSLRGWPLFREPRRLLYRHHPDSRLRRRGDGVVPVHHHVARHQGRGTPGAKTPAVLGGIALAAIFTGQLGYVVSQHDFGTKTTKDGPSSLSRRPGCRSSKPSKAT